jgi:hypothetical protein
MPKGPSGQKRPADAIGLAVMVGKIATGEIEDNSRPETQLQREGGRKGGEIRSERMPRERRVDAARGAAEARWKATLAEPGKKEPQEH